MRDEAAAETNTVTTEAWQAQLATLAGVRQSEPDNRGREGRKPGYSAGA